MKFILKNKRTIDIVLTISIILDVIVGYVINKVSGEAFNLQSTHNIILLAILAAAIVGLIVCKRIEVNTATPVKNRKLQKAFQENGGYEAIVDEMKSCIKDHDLKSLKDLKKMVDIIER